MENQTSYVQSGSLQDLYLVPSVMRAMLYESIDDKYIEAQAVCFITLVFLLVRNWVERTPDKSYMALVLKCYHLLKHWNACFRVDLHFDSPGLF